MALKASAAPFVMQSAFDDVKLLGAEETGACSTAAPSPALTSAGSPPFSPWESPTNGPYVANMWAQSKQGWLAPPPFDLPAAQEAGTTDFELSGLQGLQSTLASIFAKHIPSKAGQQKSEAIELPPGLSPPPGLPLPPGLELAASSPVAPQHLPGDCTTVMLRNIPNKYSRERLAAVLKEDGFGSDVDFLYLPIDFRNKCNVGYAFLSFRTAQACARFTAEYHHRNATDKLPGFKSKKVCEVSEARCQGREENVRRLQASQVMQQLLDRPDWLPLLFDADGNVEEFPIPKSVKAKASATAGVSKTSGRASAGRVSR